MHFEFNSVVPRRSALIVAGILGLAASHAAAQMAEKKMDEKTSTVEVTITNLTNGQPLSPPIIVSHNPSMHLFEMGQTATPALQKLAEMGMSTELAAMCKDKATDVQAAQRQDMILPGKSMTVKVKCKPGDVISVASMVSASNDTFTGVDSAKVDSMMGDGKMAGDKMPDKMPDKMDGMSMENGMMTIMAKAYDAGTEENTEKTTDTAAPDHGMGHPATSPPQPIAVSKGLTGAGDLEKAKFGWDGPVAKITMKMEK